MPQGVYLFLGYSEKDESLLKEVTGEGAEDALGAIQGLVSYHNVNANKVSANSYQRRVHSHLLNTVNFHITVKIGDIPFSAQRDFSALGFFYF